MKNDNMNNEFDKQWLRRQQALQDAESSVPSDEKIMAMARRAQNRHHRKLIWIPYSAAACLLIGMIVFGWNIRNVKTKLPVAQEVNIEGQTVKFLCNSGCSAQDIISSAKNIINQ